MDRRVEGSPIRHVKIGLKIGSTVPVFSYLVYSTYHKSFAIS